MRSFEIPNVGAVTLQHLVLDLNGTLSNRGELVLDVATRIERLASDLQIHLLTADTLGTASRLATTLRLTVTMAANGAEKAAFVTELGADSTAAIGNGRNDAPMLRAARIGIAILGPEGVAADAIAAADVVCRSVNDALDLLLDERLLIPTLRP